MQYLGEFIGLAIGVFLATKSVSGFVVYTFTQILVVAILLFALEKIAKPVISILTLPLSILTFGLFTIVINGFGVWLLARMLDGFNVTSFGTALLGSLIISACVFIVRLLIR